MRIAIITFHCSHNYGSALQAYSLQKYLTMLGHEVKIIDYRLSKDYNQYKLIYIPKTINFIYIIKCLYSSIINFKKNKKRKISFEDFSAKYFNLTDLYRDKQDMSKLNDEFDAFVCGSDQIWNFRCTGGVSSAYFLDFVLSDKIKVSYAPSLATDDFTGINLSNLSNLLESFNAVSVREESTIKVIQKYYHKEISAVVDPTLLLEESDFDELVEDLNLCADYIFLYDLKNNKDMIRYAKELAKCSGLELRYITNFSNKSLEEYINEFGCSPTRFLSLLKGARYVISNSFHATVFSVLFEKKFVAFETSNIGKRLSDFLERLSLEDRLYNDTFDIDNSIDYILVKKILKEYVSNSKKYIENNLGKVN